MIGILVLTKFSGDSHGDPERTEAAHHQWQDSPSPSHSGHQALVPVARHGQHIIRADSAHQDQQVRGTEPQRKEKPVNRDLVEMVSEK